MSSKMKKILRIIGIIIVVLVAVLVVLIGVGYLTLVAKPLKPPQAVSDLAELEVYLDDLTGHNPDSPPGLSLAVVKDGEIVYQQGFGLADGPRNIPATADTVYNQWSMVKPMTAVAALQLHEQGLLDIDDPVADYLPFFAVQYPSDSSETITIRHLLNHSSGLRNTLPPEIVNWIHFDGDPELNQTELIKEKLPDFAELAYEPGSQAVYTNVGYMVLVAVIEAASGQSYQQYMIDHIFKPLGMDQTNWTYTEAMIANEATGASPSVDLQAQMLPFVMEKEKRDALIREKRDGVMWFNHVYTDQKGPTGPIGPPTDTARFIMAYLNGGELDGQRILSEESVAMLTNESHILPGNTPEAADYKDYDEMYQGLGWAYVEEGDDFFIAHSGGGPGFAANMRLYPDRKLGMVVLANGTYLASEEISDLVASLDW
jgi:CubicO group peptidase (beta-lactamase class C family)